MRQCLPHVGDGGGDDGGDGGSVAMAARRWRWRLRGQGGAGVDGRGMRGEEEKTVAGAVWVGNLASTRFEEGSGLCVKHPFSGDTADWVFQFQHWSLRNVTSHHNDCLTKRAVSARAVRKQARKYSLLLRPLSPWPPPPHMHNKIRGVLIFWWNSRPELFSCIVGKIMKISYLADSGTYTT